MAVLLLATAVLFVVGVVVERRNEHQAERAEQPATAEHREGSEGEGGEEQAAHGENGESRETRVLGVDAEATPLVVVAVLVSIALAALLWFSDSVAVIA